MLLWAFKSFNMSEEELTSQLLLIESAKCDARRQAMEILSTLVHASSVEKVEGDLNCSVTGYYRDKHRSLLFQILASLDNLKTGNGLFLSWRGSGELQNYVIFVSMKDSDLLGLRIIGPETHIYLERDGRAENKNDHTGTTKADLPGNVDRASIPLGSTVLPCDRVYIPGLSSGRYRQIVVPSFFTGSAPQYFDTRGYDLVSGPKDSRPRYNRAQERIRVRRQVNEVPAGIEGNGADLQIDP